MLACNMKHLILTILLASVLGCGETPSSRLSETLPYISSGPHEMKFSLIPGGAFRMGSPEGEDGRSDDEAHHWVEITEDYWIQTTELMLEQWFKVMGRYPVYTAECGIHTGGIGMAVEANTPVRCVSWASVRNFIDVLNHKSRADGYVYRLPTEAEWEYAARGYTERSHSVEGPMKSFAWCGKSSRNSLENVAELKANFFGLHDIYGNAWEWVSDWYGNYPEANSYFSAVRDPMGPVTGKKRVVRGGSFSSEGYDCRSAARHAIDPNEVYINTGFRLVRTMR